MPDSTLLVVKRMNEIVFTKGPVAREHICEVGDDIERGVDDIGDGEVDDEVVGDRPHPSMGHHNPDH